MTKHSMDFSITCPSDLNEPEYFCEVISEKKKKNVSFLNFLTFTMYHFENIFIAFNLMSNYGNMEITLEFS